MVHKTPGRTLRTLLIDFRQHTFWPYFVDGSMRFYRLGLSERDHAAKRLNEQFGYNLGTLAALANRREDTRNLLPRGYHVSAVLTPHDYEGPIEWYDELMLVRDDYAIDWGLPDGTEYLPGAIRS